MSLKDLQLKQEYRTLTDNIVRDFYIPTLENAVSYKRAVGFFSSSSLMEITKGIAGLVNNNGRIQIIASPYLSEKDFNAIKNGYERRYEIIEQALLNELVEVESKNEIDRLNLLSNLIAREILDIKIAIIEKNSGIGMYHEKIGIIEDIYNNAVAFSGSMNESMNSFSSNCESIDVYCSWTGEKDRVISKKNTFEALWNDNEPYVHTLKFIDVNKKIIEKYKINDEIDLEIDKRDSSYTNGNKIKKFIKIPSNKELKDYQNDAITNWIQNDYVGIYDMATGTGKTYTALGSLMKFEENNGQFAAFIVCPYKHLVSQWEEDLYEWGIIPIIAHSGVNNKWMDLLIVAYKRFKYEDKPFVCITTNDTFREKLQPIINDINYEMKVVLIVDEVHNFGAINLAKVLPHNIKYRLGLSATVERFRDEDGTQSIINYFGNKCIEYSLEKAIKDKALVEYEYYPIVVSLLPEELEEYQNLTKKISKYFITEEGKRKPPESCMKIIFKRARLIAGAENKLISLYNILSKYKNDKHILVYCGATRGFEEVSGQKERQIDRVEKMIGNDLNMSTHRFTSEEDMNTRRLLKEGFSDGDYQVLTAIKCLDEGVNIPNIKTAFILASSRNPKEFIQRRGRVLRHSKNKNYAVIYDFVTLPKDINDIKSDDFLSDKALVIGEMARIYEFGRYSLNSRISYELLETIQNAYEIYYNYEDLNNIMEEEYGE